MLKAFAVWLLAPVLAPTLAGIQVPNKDDRVAAATAQLVTSILEYTRWPVPKESVRLCVVGPARRAVALHSSTAGERLHVLRTDLPASGTPEPEGCDALYLGSMPTEQLRRWTASVRGRAVVTIAEADPTCRGEAMFCLIFEPGSLSYRLNIDAVARSKVRIDPRVLRMARGG